jgi:polysaccharide chain length determinant protein (PEP-CTERM system associated)
MDLEQGFQLDDLRGMFHRRSVTMAVIAAAVVLLSVLVAAWIPNEYEAVTTLLIEPQAISQRLVESGMPETEINNRLHLVQMQILSRGRLSEVLESFKRNQNVVIYPELEDRLTRAEVIEHMRKKIKLTPVLPELATEARAQTGVRPGDVVVNTFLLSYRHRSARLASDVANRLANSFIEEHLRDRAAVSGDTAEFIQEELRRLSVEIGRVEKEIGDVKTGNAGSLPEDFEANQRLYERILDNLRDVQRELAVAASDEAFYHQQALAGGSADDLYSGHVLTPRRRIEVLELQLAEYRSRGFTDKHPDVIAADDEIKRLTAEIEAGADDPNKFSPVQQNARLEGQRAGLRAQAARQEIERLREQLKAVEERLAKTPRVAEQLAALEREHEHLFDSYQDFSKKGLEAGVARDMETRQKGEKFRVLEQAVMPPEPASPNRPLIVSIGLLLGLALAAAYGISAEATDTSFHTPRRLQERLGLPVLAAIPSVVLPADLAARRRALVRQVALAGVATVLVIAASGAGYYWQSIRNAPAAEAEEAPAGG